MNYFNLILSIAELEAETAAGLQDENSALNRHRQDQSSVLNSGLSTRDGKIFYCISNGQWFDLEIGPSPKRKKKDRRHPNEVSVEVPNIDPVSMNQTEFNIPEMANDIPQPEFQQQEQEWIDD